MEPENGSQGPHVDPVAPPGIDITTPHPARRYDYWLGGKDNFEADRASAEAVAEAFPSVQIAALENRAFLHRAVGYLATQAGIRQFLDLGAGLPTAGNVHEIAQAAAPESRIVYVDNDPIVALHAQSLLDSTAAGATTYLQADARDPERILTHPDVLATVDPSRPMALIMLAVVHFFTDDDRPLEVVRRLTDALAPGSYLVMSHATSDHLSEEDLAESVRANKRSGIPFQLRSTAEFGRFFTGLELVDPGIVSVINWPTESHRPHPRPEAVSMLGAVARKP
ncbi:SAM-dependent methyltransferase [Nocardia spumae]|uniref:SAM-dependent methyltransferase n=1 Tax=Nocardia spumae TaxID=2887190 RepID=UPI001D1567D4|nr:SAM-dependent methyltransferase [Nocardia spumae]